MSALHKFQCSQIPHFLYSQVNPSPENLAAKSLSNYNQKRNIRKVAVNAHVTFFLWVLETLANVSIIIVWMFIYGKTSFATLTFSMLLYYVLLPNSFLMNTSHNKHLIVDNGFWNTIRNATGLPLKCSCKPRAVYERGVSVFKRPINRTNDTTCSVDSITPGTSKDTKEVNHFVQNSLTSKAWHHPQQGSIFTLSNGTTKYIPLAMIHNYEKSCITKETGAEHHNESKSHWPSPTLDSPIPYKEEFLYDGCGFHVGKELLWLMTNNINDEEAYFYYFRQLLEFEEYSKMKDDVDNKEFAIAHNNHMQRVKTSRPKHSTLQTRTNTVLDENKECKNDTGKHISKCESKVNNELKLKVDFKVQLKDRIKKRKNMLKDIHAQCRDENGYQMYFNMLVDFEEGLINQ